jgi:hypothetical protein
MSDNSMLGFGLGQCYGVRVKLRLVFRVRSLIWTSVRVRVGGWIRVRVNVSIKMFMF